ncbi:hypothetical protein LCH18_04750 [Acinetobacter johnsonii]|uniref:hypothetical protein n=1 Tax=Acinetobacter johnsonii TaxID=40214 RepID=UPI001CCE41C5|nr:hypothetical protein [Acinetobacter johnsonii]UBQ38690.1 hypothetical protein LCH18_04750 [Acinetobacter johnsonii]
MNVLGIGLIILLSLIGLGALITGFAVGETFFVVIGLLIFIMAFLVWLSLKDKFQILLKIKNVVID